MEFRDYKNQDIKLDAIWSSEANPTYNGTGGCTPECVENVGAISWSYTNMTCRARLKLPNTKTQKFANGIGWMDNTLLSGQFITNRLVRWLASFTPTYKIAKWVWITMQLDNPKIQWSYHNFISSVPIAVGTTLSNRFNFLNSYDGTGNRISYQPGEIDFQVQVLDNTSITSFISGKPVLVPNKYKITIKQANEQSNTVYILKSDFTGGERYTPNANINVGLAGSVWNESETKRLGCCFMESHQLQSDEDNLAVTAKVANVPGQIL